VDDEQEKFRLLLSFEAFQTILHWVLFIVAERRSFFFLANHIFLNIEKIVLVQEIVLFYRFTKIDILI